MTELFTPQFWSLGLCDELIRATERLGYDEPTPVQVATIPAVLRGDDVWASAKTGSGKTAAFVLPMLQALSSRAKRAHGSVFALLLVPTRELAVQTAAAIDALAAHLPAPPKTCVAVGGVSINPQMLSLRGGADVVVATPGRLLDLCDNNAVVLADVQMLVLDEADRLLSLGFADDLSRVMARLPAGCQRLLFSATFPAAIRALAATLLRHPTQINIDAGALPEANTIAQRVIEVDANRRTMLLRQLLQTHGWSRTLVFVATKQAAATVAQKLARAGLRASALHGEQSQSVRSQALAAFKAGELQVLVATDLAGRGIDINDLPAVVNYDLPRSPTDYLHRIGRTGRAGGAGVAISFVDGSTAAHFTLIERRHHISLVRETIVGFEPSATAPPPAHPHGGVKGKRKSKKDKLREAAARAKVPS